METKPLEAKFITTVIGTNPSQDEGYWENIEYATHEDFNPTDGNYKNYHYVKINDSEGYWEKNEQALIIS
jgi:hypothetical protein